MKIFIGKPHDHWLSPYTIKEKFFFWKSGYDAYKNTPCKTLETACEWLKNVLDIIHPDIVYVKIDDYDVWSVDYTLAHIIHPMLIKLKEKKQGAPCVDNCDVPEHLKSFNAPRFHEGQNIDDFFFDRWDWVLDEMIFAFDSIITYEAVAVTFKSRVRIDNGARLFGKYYSALWW